MAVEVTITDLSADVKAAKDAAVQRALEAIGLEAEKYAKLHLEDSPRRVDTGRLNGSQPLSKERSHTAFRPIQGNHRNVSQRLGDYNGKIYSNTAGHFLSAPDGRWCSA